MDVDGAARQGVAQRGRLGDHDVHGLGQRGTERGVDDVRGREPVVDPRSFGHADSRLHHVDEGRGVVVGDPFAFVDRGHELGVDDRSALTQRRDVGVRQHAAFGEALGGEEFDFQHGVESMFVAEEFGHVLRGIPRNHRSPLGHGDKGDVAAHHPPFKGYERRAVVGATARLGDGLSLPRSRRALARPR